MEDGFGIGTLVLVGFGCGALGYLSGVEEPPIPTTESSRMRRSAKRVKQWVHDLKQRRAEKRAEKKAAKTVPPTTVTAHTIAQMAEALGDPEVLAELKRSKRKSPVTPPSRPAPRSSGISWPS